MQRLMEPGAQPGEAVHGALMTGLADYMSGKHEFGPAQQNALVQQFSKSYVPTTRGWRKRVSLADRAVQQLRSDPSSAAGALVQLQKVAPDPEMRQFASEALARIRSGRAMTPEGVNALATIAQQMEQSASRYRKATPVIDSMNIMKELYGSGQLNEEEMAKNLGLISGRFGAKGGEAEALRRLIQNALARPVATQPRSPYKETTQATPGVSRLVRKAMSR